MQRQETIELIKENKASPVLKQGAALLRAGKISEALGIVGDAILKDPNDVQAWRLLSQIQFKAGMVRDAAVSASKSVELEPKTILNVLQLARCRAALGDHPRALGLIEKIEALTPSGAEDFDAMGAICSLCGEQNSAEKYFQRAVSLVPNNPYYLHNLATAQRFLGDFTAAEKTCDETIAINPRDYRTYYLRSDLRRQTEDRNHIQEMTGILKAGISDWRGEICIRYALGKEYEDLGDDKAAFDMFEKAARLQRSHMRYDVEEDVSIIEKIISAHDEAWFDGATSGFGSEEPIFIVGLPRTGTTLVERIIGAHSDVYPAGELSNFAAAVIEAATGKAQGKKLSRLDLVERSRKFDFEALGRAYIESTRPQTGELPRFIDKMPQNFLYGGLIAASLPKAKIICLRRDPMDACFAMYKTMFTGAYPFTYDLQDLGQYYLAFQKLINHWESLFGHRFLIIDYESLVRNFEMESKKIVEFCGLEWQSACLDFHLSEKPASTASAVQVRQPVYSSSIGKWRRYEAQLAPLEKYFKEAGLDLFGGSA